MTDTPYATPTVAKARNAALVDFSDSLIQDAIAEFEHIAETYLDHTYTTRTTTEQITARPLYFGFNLAHTPVQSITSITSDGVSVSTSTLILNKAKGEATFCYWPNPFPLNAEVTYTYGETSTPAILVRAAIEYAARTLGSEASGMTRDVQWAGPDGSARYVTPSWKDGRPTGWLDIDRWLNSFSESRQFLVG